MKIKSVYACGALTLGLAIGGLPAQAQDFSNFQTIATGFSSPVGVYQPPGESSRLFVVEQTGRIRIINVGGTPSAPTYTVAATPFLSLAALDAANPYFRSTGGVPFAIPRLISGGEQGLLGLAFSPDFPASGKLYINYTQNNPNLSTGAVDPNGRTVVMEFTVDPANPNAVLPSSERMIIAINQPFTNHNGGCIRFGPDGYLYVGMGDGGSGNDPINAGLNPNTLLGKMLRLDVSRDDYPADSMRNYGIPADNPFASGVGGRPEIWARGLRNPWRYSFDKWNGDLWIGDVGQNFWEEVHRVPGNGGPGRNYGWRVREGFASTGLSSGGFDISNLTPPIYVYPHAASQSNATVGTWTASQAGISIVGGMVYRGNIRPLRGRYYFVDTYRSTFWSFPANVQPTPTGWLGTPAQVGLTETSALQLTGGLPTLSFVVAFGEDNDGEMYLVEQGGGGRIRKLVPAGTQPALADAAGPGQSVGADGQYTADDIIVYLNWFFASDPRADVSGPGQSPRVDQQLTADDIIVFLNAFFAGI